MPHATHLVNWSVDHPPSLQLGVIYSELWSPELQKIFGKYLRWFQGVAVFLIGLMTTHKFFIIQSFFFDKKFSKNLKNLNFFSKIMRRVNRPRTFLVGMRRVNTWSWTYDKALFLTTELSQLKKRFHDSDNILHSGPWNWCHMNVNPSVWNWFFVQLQKKCKVETIQGYWIFFFSKNPKDLCDTTLFIQRRKTDIIFEVNRIRLGWISIDRHKRGDSATYNTRFY